MVASKEVLIEFADEFSYMSNSFKTKILSLQSSEDFENTVNDLFRQVHSLKAISQYAKIDPLYQLLKILEDVFQILRFRQKTIKDELLLWLLKINDQLQLWSESFECGIFNIASADPYIINMVKISSVSSIKTTHSIKESTILLYTRQSTHLTLFKKISPFYKRLIIVNTLEDCEENIKHESPDFIFVSSEFELENIILLHQIATMKNIINFMPIVISDTAHFIKQFNQAGITFFIDNQITPKSLLQRLVTQSKIINTASWITFPNNDVMSTIKKIEPLPEIIIKVQQLITSEHSTTRDVANLLENDPLLTTRILQIINNPSFGLKQKISTLHHAVSLLGKGTIGALILQEKAQNHFSSFDLKIYGLDNQRELYAIAKKRMDLIVRWYSKVDMGMLPVLATTALLGNIGVFVIAEAAKKNHLENEFINMSQLNGYRVAELEYFNMTAEEISASIFDHWKLGSLITNSVRYSYDFENAPEDVRPYALANFIVNTAIDYPTRGKEKENLQDLLSFVKTMGFDEQKFLNAYESVL